MNVIKNRSPPQYHRANSGGNNNNCVGGILRSGSFSRHHSPNWSKLANFKRYKMCVKLKEFSLLKKNNPASLATHGRHNLTQKPIEGEQVRWVNQIHIISTCALEEGKKGGQPYMAFNGGTHRLWQFERQGGGVASRERTGQTPVDQIVLIPASVIKSFQIPQIRKTESAQKGMETQQPGRKGKPMRWKMRG